MWVFNPVCRLVFCIQLLLTWCRRLQLSTNCSCLFAVVWLSLHRLCSCQFPHVLLLPFVYWVYSRCCQGCYSLGAQLATVGGIVCTPAGSPESFRQKTAGSAAGNEVMVDRAQYHWCADEKTEKLNGGNVSEQTDGRAEPTLVDGQSDQ